MQCLDLAQVASRHILTVNHAFEMTYESDGTPIKARITFAETATRFGGRRLWLLCPVATGTAALSTQGEGASPAGFATAFATAHKPRHAPIAFKIVRRLDPVQHINDLPPKPKGMHWRTYNRLVERYEAHDNQWSLEAMRRFGMWL
jgi:hypothetical protein